jgi:hypothetical protein
MRADLNRKAFGLLAPAAKLRFMIAWRLSDFAAKRLQIIAQGFSPG